MAGRRPFKPKVRSEYEFQSIEECEESEKYGGIHRVEVTQWPPKSQHGEVRPTMSARCTRCGGWGIVYGDNKPEDSGIEVVVLKREPREKVGA